jgi:hypothetical protein
LRREIAGVEMYQPNSNIRAIDLKTGRSLLSHLINVVPFFTTQSKKFGSPAGDISKFLLYLNEYKKIFLKIKKILWKIFNCGLEQQFICEYLNDSTCAVSKLCSPRHAA